MANTGRRVAVALVMAMVLTGRSAAAGEETLTLVLRVENHAGVSRQVLDQAEAQATRVYAAIRVRLIWVHDDSVDPALPTRHLKVLLLSREMAEQKIASDGIADHELGRAGARTGQAHIFVDRIEAIAAKHQRYAASVLGPVLAHEVGHMLLPSDSHSASGIMRANLEVRSKIPQQFTEAQGATIRRLLNASGASKETQTADVAAVAAR